MKHMVLGISIALVIIASILIVRFRRKPEGFSDEVYSLIFPPNGVLITTASGISPNYTVQQLREIFARYINITLQYNSFTPYQMQTEDTALSNFPPVNVLNFDLNSFLQNIQYLDTYNNNRMVATLNFVSAQMGLSVADANDVEISDMIAQLNTGFPYDPMTAVPITGASL